MAAADASPRWAPTLGLVAGAAIVIVGVVMASDAHKPAASALLAAVLMLPLVGRWPLSRPRAVAAAVLWILVGLALAWAGGFLIALAALPASVGALVGWGTRAT